MESTIDILIDIPDQDSLIIDSPPSLSQLLHTISLKSTDLPNPFYLLYKRKEKWFKIADNSTYQKIIKDSIKAQKEEIEMKVASNFDDATTFCSSSISTTSHESEMKRSDQETNLPTDKNIIHYRYLNGTEPSCVKSLQINSLNIWLSDVSNMIVQKERFDAREWVCAMFSADGSPLIGSLAMMYLVKADEVLLKGSTILLYIVPNFDIKSAEKLAPYGNDCISATCDKKKLYYSIRIDLSTATVLNLRQILFYFTNIPTYEIELRLDDNFLHKNDVLLKSYSVTSSSNFKFKRIPYPYSTFTYKKDSIQSIPQSNQGLRALHSFLHTFRKKAAELNSPSLESLLGCVRQFTFNDAAYVSALYYLSKDRNISLLSSIALEEGSIQLAKTFIEDVFKLHISKNSLLEHIIDVFAVLCEISCRPQTEFSRNEIFKSYFTDCPLTQKTLENPVLLKSTDGTSKYYEYSEILNTQKTNQSIPNIILPNHSELRLDPNFKCVCKRAALNDYSEVWLWEGSYQPSPSISRLISQYYPSGLTLTESTSLSSTYTLTTILPALTLKTTEFENCLSRNKDRNLVICLKLGCVGPNELSLMDILTRETEKVYIEDLASSLENPYSQSLTRVPEEAIVVVFDVSGSMKKKFVKTLEFSRLQATKEFFETFTDRNAGYNFHHVVSLLLFNDQLNKVCDFTENVVTFSTHVKDIASRGDTRLWDALFTAIEYLNEFKIRFPMVKLRILCLSDGEDTMSSKKFFDVAKALCEFCVTMDAIVVGELCNELKAAAFVTGGYVFKPSTVEEGIELFESEIFLSAKLRQTAPLPKIKSLVDLEPLKELSITNVKSLVSLKPSQLASKKLSMQAALSKISKERANAANPHLRLLERISLELEALINEQHPYLQVYPSDSDCFFWSVFMTAPEFTPYENGIFHLAVEFPENYPYQKPVVKFVTPIYHCNVTRGGIVCHSILVEDWSSRIYLKNVFECVYSLFYGPEEVDVVSMGKITEFRTDRDEYLRKACKYTKKYAGKSVEEIMSGHETKKK